MEHQFNTEVAKVYGLSEAVFLHNLYWWIVKNEANGRHFYEGRHWTYNSLSALEKLFPYFTKSQIRTVIANCEKKGAIVRGNFNKAGYDNTTWYALTEEVLAIYGGYADSSTPPAESSTGCVKSNTAYAKSSTSCAKSSTPIPDSKPYSKPDNKPDREPSTGFAAFWEAYPLKRGKGDAEKAWKKIKPDKELVGIILEALSHAKASRDWVKENGKYIPYPSKWLNGKRWEDEYQPTAEADHWQETKKQLEGDEIW